MRTIFNDPLLEEAFERDGFIIINSNLLPDAEDIKARFLEMKPNDDYQGFQSESIKDQSFHVTFFDSNAEYKQQVFDYTQSLFLPLAKYYLNDYVCPQANIFLKPKGKGFVHPHQNLTIVDEEKYRSLSIWMPLQDTDFDNGTICIIPKSHQFQFQNYRNTHVRWPYVDFFSKGQGLNYFQPINVKQGEVLILNDRLIHYTPENKTTNDRWVVHSLWKPREADLLYIDPTDSGIYVYHVEHDFWQIHNPDSYQLNRQPNEILDKSEPLFSDDQLLAILDEDGTE